MPSLRTDTRSRNDSVVFRFVRRQYQRNLRTKSRRAASSACARIEEAVPLIERGRIELPPATGPAVFIFSDGKLTERPTTRRLVTAGEFFDYHVETRRSGVTAASTREAGELHLEQRRRLLPVRQHAEVFSTGDLQS